MAKGGVTLRQAQIQRRAAIRALETKRDRLVSSKDKITADLAVVREELRRARKR